MGSLPAITITQLSKQQQQQQQQQLPWTVRQLTTDHDCSNKSETDAVSDVKRGFIHTHAYTASSHTHVCNASSHTHVCSADVDCVVCCCADARHGPVPMLEQHMTRDKCRAIVMPAIPRLTIVL